VDERSELVRARSLAAIPSSYVPWLHLGATLSVGVAAIVVAITQIRDLRAVELLTLPATFLLSNAFEWRAHKSVLHKRRWPLHELYDRHTPMHHVVYRYESMAIRSTREFRMVLIPAIGVAAVVVVTAPFAWIVSKLLTPNTGWLVLVMSAVYVVAYEVSHLSYHLPEESFVGRLRVVRVLREHHRRHHHPALMTRYNFNVTIPVFDWLHRSIASDDVVRAALDARTGDVVEEIPEAVAASKTA
jgi:hypothetical protein